MTPTRPFPAPRFLLPPLALLLAGLAPRLGAEDYDLARTSPVPEGQQMPVGDFFRPALAQEPRINRAGTEIAAVVTAGEDRHLLLVYDLRSRKYGMVGGNGDYDINQIRWLSDTRLVYEVSAQKLYGIGLYAANVDDLSNTYPLLQYLGARLIDVPRKDPLSPLVWVSWGGLQQPGGDKGAALVNSSRLSRDKGVNLLADGAATSAGLAIQQVCREKKKIYLVTGPASSDFTGKQCSPYSMQFSYDTYALAHGTGTALTRPPLAPSAFRSGLGRGVGA